MLFLNLAGCVMGITSLIGPNPHPLPSHPLPFSLFYFKHFLVAKVKLFEVILEASLSLIPQLKSFSKFCWFFLQNTLEFNHLSPPYCCHPGPSLSNSPWDNSNNKLPFLLLMSVLNTAATVVSNLGHSMFLLYPKSFRCSTNSLRKIKILKMVHGPSTFQACLQHWPCFPPPSPPHRLVLQPHGPGSPSTCRAHICFRHSARMPFHTVRPAAFLS